MNEPPRRSDARILTLPRFGRLLTYGSTMAVGSHGEGAVISTGLGSSATRVAAKCRNALLLIQQK